MMLFAALHDSACHGTDHLGRCDDVRPSGKLSMATYMPIQFSSGRRVSSNSPEALPVRGDVELSRQYFGYL
jgi:hypothetical protein